MFLLIMRGRRACVPLWPASKDVLRVLGVMCPLKRPGLLGEACCSGLCGRVQASQVSGSARLSALSLPFWSHRAVRQSHEALSPFAGLACGRGAARRRRARPRSQPARASARRPTTTAAEMGAARAAGAWGAASGSSGSSCCPGRCADWGRLGCGALPAAVCVLCCRRVANSTLYFASGTRGLCPADMACILWCGL